MTERTNARLNANLNERTNEQTNEDDDDDKFSNSWIYSNSWVVLLDGVLLLNEVLFPERMETHLALRPLLPMPLELPWPCAFRPEVCCVEAAERVEAAEHSVG